MRPGLPGHGGQLSRVPHRLATLAANLFSVTQRHELGEVDADSSQDEPRHPAHAGRHPKFGALEFADDLALESGPLCGAAARQKWQSHHL